MSTDTTADKLDCRSNTTHYFRESKVLNERPTSLIVWIDVCVRFGLSKSSNLFIYSQKSDEEKMNHRNSCEHYCVNVHTDRTICVCDSFHHLMYVMKESSEILFQFFLWARWQRLENQSHCSTTSINFSKRLILQICWLLSLNLCSKTSYHNDWTNKNKWSSIHCLSEWRTWRRKVKLEWKATDDEDRKKQQKTKKNQKQKQQKNNRKTTQKQQKNKKNKIKIKKKNVIISFYRMIQNLKILNIEIQMWIFVCELSNHLIDDLLIEQSKTIADMRNCWLINWTSLNR